MILITEDWFTVRKKPVQVEARGPYRSPDEIDTIEGDFEIDEAYIEEHGGYYIIRGVEGEVYPCAVDVFKQTYQRVQKLDHQPEEQCCLQCDKALGIKEDDE